MHFLAPKMLLAKGGVKCYPFKLSGIYCMPREVLILSPIMNGVKLK